MTLTARQYDVLVCLSRGMTAQATAAHLGITEETVKWHAKMIRVRLGVRSAGAAVAVAFQRGILA